MNRWPPPGTEPAEMTTEDRSRPLLMSFEQFAASSHRHWENLAFLLTGDHGHAEDLVQEALIRAYRNWPAAQNAPYAYLRRTLINLNHDRFRALAARVREIESIRDEPAGADPFTVVLDRETITPALQALSDRQRAVIIMQYWEQLSLSEIADTLDCSVGSVKTHSHRAIQKMRAHLRRDPQLDEPGGGRNDRP